MIVLFSLLLFATSCLFFIGLFSPKTSLFWYKKQKTRKASFFIYGGSAILLIVFAAVSAPPITQAEKDAWAMQRHKEEAAAQDAAKANAPKVPELGEAIQTEYFAVRVNSFDFKSQVSTGNQFADLKEEAGNKYIIINVSLKNNDDQSRMMFDGEIRVKSGSKEIRYDKAEMVMLDGWGILMETINPGVTKTTNIVYKVPADIHGAIYYLPSRSSDEDLIKVATL